MRVSDAHIQVRQVSRRTALTILALFGATALLSACNTAKGFGKDVEAVGDAISDAADDARD